MKGISTSQIPNLACQADKGKSNNYENNARTLEATVSHSVNSCARHIGPLVNSVHLSVICHFNQPLSSFLHAILPLQTQKFEQPSPALLQPQCIDTDGSPLSYPHFISLGHHLEQATHVGTATGTSA